MPTRRTQLGFRGETVAREWLERQGFTFVTANFRTRYGEIDLVMRDGRTLVFVEVKTRRSRKFGAAEESIDERKLERWEAAAELYLQKHPAKQVRFDVVAIDQRGPVVEVRHMPGIE